LASRKKAVGSRERSVSRAREERRAEESAALRKASEAYLSALAAVSEAVLALNRSARALDLASSAFLSPELSRYGVAARLRPADLRRAVDGASRDLRSLASRARSLDITVPDGTEEAYGRLISGLAEASDTIVRSMEEFGSSVPRGSHRPPPVVRDLISAAVRAASILGRLAGRGRTLASVHLSAVADEISSRDVSFY